MLARDVSNLLSPSHLIPEIEDRQHRIWIEIAPVRFQEIKSQLDAYRRQVLRKTPTSNSMHMTRLLQHYDSHLLKVLAISVESLPCPVPQQQTFGSEISLTRQSISKTRSWASAGRWLRGCLGRKDNPVAIWLTRRHAFVMGAVWLSLMVGGGFGYALASHSRLAPVPFAQQSSLTKKTLANSLMLDELRQASLLGDASTTGELATLLLDRYDLDGDHDDLFEALIWIDRNLYAPQNVALVKRIVSRYCDHPVLQWHALCLTGE